MEEEIGKTARAGAQHPRRIVAHTTEEPGESKSPHLRLGHQLPLGGCSFVVDRLSAHKINERHVDTTGLLPSVDDSLHSWHGASQAAIIPSRRHGPLKQPAACR